MQPPVPILETTSIRSMETVLRIEPNAISILARCVVAEMEAAGHWRGLPHRLSWILPLVSFFTTTLLEGHSMVQALRDVVGAAAREMQGRLG